MAQSKELKAGRSVPQDQARRLAEVIDTIVGREMRLPKEEAGAFPNISAPEMRGLMYLGRRGMMVMTDFAQGIGVPLSTATRIITRLEKKGIAIRRRSDADRRIVEVDLSPVAYEHRNRFLARRLLASERMLSTLTPRERETLLALIEKSLRLSAPSADDHLCKKS